MVALQHRTCHSCCTAATVRCPDSVWATRNGMECNSSERATAVDRVGATNMHCLCLLVVPAWPICCLSSAWACLYVSDLNLHSLVWGMVYCGADLSQKGKGLRSADCPGESAVPSSLQGHTTTLWTCNSQWALWKEPDSGGAQHHANPGSQHACIMQAPWWLYMQLMVRVLHSGLCTTGDTKLQVACPLQGSGRFREKGRDLWPDSWRRRLAVRTVHICASMRLGPDTGCQAAVHWVPKQLRAMQHPYHFTHRAGVSCNSV
jgi:hypothetical protein